MTMALGGINNHLQWATIGLTMINNDATDKERQWLLGVLTTIYNRLQ
jgi:hypothetical protein